MIFVRSKAILMSLAAILLLTFLFAKTQVIDFKKHNQAIDHLRQLKQMDTFLNQDILKLRFGFLGNYDSIVKSTTAIQKLIGSLKEGPFAIDHQGKGEFDFYIETVEALFDEKKQWIERFASENTTLNNSLRFFPIVMANIMAQTQKNELKGPLINPLNDLLRTVLVYNLTASEELKPKIRTSANRIRETLDQYPTEMSVALNNAMDHTTIILNQKEEVDGMVAKLVGMPTMKRIDELYEAYTEHHDQIVKVTDIYRFCLYFCCLLLLSAIIHFMYQLKRSVHLLDQRSQELAKVNKDLEQEVTVRKRAYEKLQKTRDRMLQSEKMAAVGQMAGGVAHEIKNPLGVILGYSQGLVNRLQPGDPNEQPIRSIEREANRCKQFVQDMLTFSRVGKTEMEAVDINKAIEGAFSLVMAGSKVKDVELKTELEEGLQKVLANLNQLQQVIVNLGNNAIDAMEAGGKLIVRTKKAEMEGKDTVEIQVEDTGSGIPPEIQAKIFEPFFTSKGVGKGTGLGLSLVYEIIEKHHGSIRLESEVGKGTIFYITLPVCE